MALAGAAGLLIFFVVYLGIIALMITSVWKIYAKANQPGWACLIPVYNLIIYFRIIQRPKWWIIIYLGAMLAYFGITLLSFMLVMGNGVDSTSLGLIMSLNVVIILALFVISILDTHRLSKAFGKGVGFTFGLLFLAFIFIPILAFGDAQYQYGENQRGIDAGTLDSNL